MNDILRTFAKLWLQRGTFRSYSQFGEDAAAAPLLRGIEKGVYVDIGAYHPHLYSNTYSFYRRGWRGVVVDPNPRMQRLFRLFRPRDRFILAGVAGREGERTYYEYADPAFNGFEQVSTGASPIRYRTVPLRTLSSIVKEHGLAHIDLLSIDTEGMEDEIFAAYDWQVLPGVIIMEGDADSDAARILLARGYELLARLGLSLVFRRVR